MAKSQTMSRKSLVLMGLMLLFAVAALSLKPTKRWADLHRSVVLETTIPERFGDWSEIKQSNQHIINPQEEVMLSELYSQTLSKSYKNSAGYIIMLSVAYGGDQSRDLQVHRPEVCYSAQGFQIVGQDKVSLNLVNQQLPAMHVQARISNRIEPITYWVRIGDKIVRGNIEQGFARLYYGIKGFIADGLLFRVSSIDAETGNAFKVQEQFVNDLISALSDSQRASLIGTSLKSVTEQSNSNSLY